VETLEQEIVETELAISGLPPARVRTLEKSLRALTPGQRFFVSETLTQARTDKSLSPRYLLFLEHFFEKWSSHGLATKLVLLNRLGQLAIDAHVSTESDPPQVLAEFFDLPDCIAQTN
jgi:hypothetical protein